MRPDSDPLPPQAPASPRRWGLTATLLLAGLALTLVALFAATRWAGQRALDEVAARTDAAIQLNRVALRSSLDKFRAMPLVLAQDPEVLLALRERDQAQIERLDDKLDALARGVGASAIYLLDTQGRAIAASNWREPATFVGVDYQFRPYFRLAVAQGQAEYFALGTVSHEPGLYLSRRIDAAPGRLAGVIVLKMEFNALEADWQVFGDPLFVTDEQGVLLIGNVPQWQFRTLHSLPEARVQALRESLQFGEAPLTPLPLEPLPSRSSEPPVTADAPRNVLARLRESVGNLPAGATVLHSALPVQGTAGWTLHILAPTQAAVARATTNAQLTVLLLLAGASALAVFLVYRRNQLQRRTLEQARIKQELETQVQTRTRQLRATNTELLAQIDERQRTESRLHAMQDELVQANKLALLGQVAAGVAHELNQPLAAIRAYADNAAEFLRRDEPAPARENLQTIARLTERIGNVTGELRTFSRKAAAHVVPLRLADAIEGALMLVGPRLKRQQVALHYDPLPAHLDVLADRMRLEQVLVNLLQNALDALEHQPAGPATPAISLTLTEHTDTVALRLRDNGPGLDPGVLAKLFTPFQTTKPEGLGLGLVISRDILTEFGGTLHASNPADGGAEFTLTLRRAPVPPATQP
ncbi:ATP-binding protein [Bordetella genomosp. 5]|uniref:ATP-binding protein n=1 Tax=Bordetella genomosp. 5 TaxID=1395608 RepID=UPI0020CE57C3|nr:ATP-binding protein [Bordetella genomosp. 5]